MVDKGPVQKVDKAWGFEEWWCNEPEYCFKILVVKPGFTSSKHYHKKKKETLIVLKGTCHLYLWKRDKEQHVILTPEDKVLINPGYPHQFWVEPEEKEPCIIYEIATHHDDEDVVRETESGAI
jgi:mannose-6-phosphate isomerase-like protein (cupin superfamily)